MRVRGSRAASHRAKHWMKKAGRETVCMPFSINTSFISASG